MARGSAAGAQAPCTGTSGGGKLAEAARGVRPGGRVVVVDMMPHEREDLREAMGQVWQGFSAGQMSSWMEGAGLTAMRYLPLPADPAARGPVLFAASARRRE